MGDLDSLYSGAWEGKYLWKMHYTNKNLFASSLELLKLAGVEMQKDVLVQKLLKLELD